MFSFDDRFKINKLTAYFKKMLIQQKLNPPKIIFTGKTTRPSGEPTVGTFLEAVRTKPYQQTR